MTEAGTRAVRILIVEDNEGDVLLVREALRESGLNFELQHAPDGDDALRLAGGMASSGLPDLLLLDLNLPKRDGWEVLEDLRSRAGFRSVPVVVLSSSSAPEDLSRSRLAGAALYIRKPSTLDEFLSIGKQIAAFLAGRR